MGLVPPCSGCRGAVRQLNGLRDSEVEYLRDARARDENISWLQVAMHDAFAVRIGQCVGDTLDERDALFACQPCTHLPQ